jgi:hypothetical protein
MTAICKLCSHKLKAEPDNIVDGHSADRTQERLGKLIAVHLNERHQPDLMGILQSSATFNAWLMMSQFDSDDANFRDQVATIRKQVLDLLMPGAIQRPGEA